MRKRTLPELEADYMKLCVFMGDWIVKTMFNNKAIIAKYMEFISLSKEAKELEDIKAAE